MCLLCFLFLDPEDENRGRLKRKIRITFSTRQSSVAPTESAKVMGMEFSRSQGRRVIMSSSMAFIWKWVARMPHTWKSWWLWPAGGAVPLGLRHSDSEIKDHWANDLPCCYFRRQKNMKRVRREHYCSMFNTKEKTDVLMCRHRVNHSRFSSKRQTEVPEGNRSVLLSVEW